MNRGQMTNDEYLERLMQKCVNELVNATEVESAATARIKIDGLLMISRAIQDTEDRERYYKSMRDLMERFGDSD